MNRFWESILEELEANALASKKDKQLKQAFNVYNKSAKHKIEVRGKTIRYVKKDSDNFQIIVDLMDLNTEVNPNFEIVGLSRFSGPVVPIIKYVPENIVGSAKDISRALKVSLVSAKNMIYKA